MSAYPDAFKDLWGKANVSRYTLVKIELTEPSALTLHWSSAEVHTPDGQTWQAGVRGGGSLRASIGWLDPGVSPVACSIPLANVRDASQASGTILNLLSQYLFQNALVTVFLYTPGHDPVQAFQGKVSRPADEGPEGVTLHLLQDQSWNRQLPPVVDKVNAPDSPDVSQGAVLPIIYGDHSAPGLPAPWATPYGAKDDQEDSGAGSGVVPYVLVDAGVGAADVKVVVACHECADILDRANGRSAFMVGDNILNPLDLNGVTETLDAAESFLLIEDENAIVYGAVIPTDVRAAGGGNTAGGPRRAMDPFDPTTFAVLDQATSKNELQLILPNMGALGNIVSVEALIAFRGNSSNTHNLRVNAFTPGVGAGGSPPASVVSTGTTPQIYRVAWPTGYWSQDWAFGTNPATGAVFDLRVDFAGGTTNKASIFWVGLVVKYRPQRSLVTPGRTYLQRTEWQNAYGHRNRKKGSPGRPNPIHFFFTVEPEYKVDSQFYGNPRGYKDDGSGTFTDSASSLIQRPPDIIRHFLVTWGLVSGGDTETGVGTFGSFKDVRSVLRNAQPNDLKLAVHIGERTTVQRALQKMADQSGMCVYQDRITGKWMAFAWKPGAIEDYGRKLSWDAGDFLAVPKVEEVSVVETRRAIRVKYGVDHFRNKPMFEAFINPVGSGQGMSLPTIRDQRLTATAGVNDDLDFRFGATTYAAVIGAGTHTPMELCASLRASMRSATGNNNQHMGFGFFIVNGYNHLLDFVVGGTPYQATIAEGEYTAEGLATEVARAMNSVPATGRVFACTYNHSTNKFTVSATGGTFQLDGTSTAPGNATSAVQVLGQNSLVAAASSLTMTFPRYGDRFWFLGSTSDAFQVFWASGASAATNCADLLGFLHVDQAVGLAADISATYSRGDRERLAEELDGWYDPREENGMVADWIRDETTAVERRNREFDLTAKPRPVIRQLNTWRLPDIRLMQVIECEPDLDKIVPFPRYGSDGSWKGKALRVLEYEVHLGPRYDVDIVAWEA